MRDIDVAGTGFTTLDRVYSGAARAVAEALGGSCGNVLVSLAMLRRRVAPILTLGCDDVGQRLIREFEWAGAEMRFIRCMEERRSPVLAQHLDVVSRSHWFAWTCPETDEALPRYEPIGAHDLELARSAIEQCWIFYADRASEAIVEAMETASAAGAVVFFEPSEFAQTPVFERAVAASAILKYSADRIGSGPAAGAHTVVIETHGEEGLRVQRGAEHVWLRPFAAPDVIDTCGSGDMVSVGLIHWLLTLRPSRKNGLDLSAVIPGVRSGQRLAAENCAYVGARGLFRDRGADYAKSILEA